MTAVPPVPAKPPTTGEETIVIGLGANVGNARATTTWALQQLKANPAVQVQQVSSLYRIRPVDADGPEYLNAVASLSTSLEPEALLSLAAGLGAASRP